MPDLVSVQKSLQLEAISSKLLWETLQDSFRSKISRNEMGYSFFSNENREIYSEYNDLRRGTSNTKRTR